VGKKEGGVVTCTEMRTNIATIMRAHVIIIMLLLLTVFFASTFQINLLGYLSAFALAFAFKFDFY
jgi:hypothetical protein